MSTNSESSPSAANSESSPSATNNESSVPSARMLKLKSSDDEIFEVKEELLLESITLKNIVEEDGFADTEIIPVPNVEGRILSKVIQYCQKHVEARAEAKAKDSGSEEAARNDDIKKFDLELVDTNKDILFDLVTAANYLNIAGLMDLTCQAIADFIRDMSIEETRKTFNIENDFTPEEEEKLRDEVKWAFE